jgi:hypothetical protein
MENDVKKNWMTQLQLINNSELDFILLRLRLLPKRRKKSLGHKWIRIMVRANTLLFY